MKNLPLGIHSMDKLMGNNCLYVDKTDMAWNLIQHPGAFFLSRPRRFGKSLFLDTLKEIFEGNRSLFKGLYIHDKWDWSRKFPVIKIDFADGTVQTREELDRRIYNMLDDEARYLELTLTKNKDIPGTLGELIRKAMEKYSQRAVVLVDEYDKPILDNINNPDIAAQMREGLKNLYSVFKRQDASLQFVFMTGVSKFSKVSLFSGLNQLRDITISPQFATICGYTHSDLEHHFAEYMKGVDWEKLRRWYNGYQWLGEAVYNPYDILLFITGEHSYRNYWFETGNPSFLVKLFEKNRYFLPDMEDPVVTEQILDSFDVEQIDPLTLLFQTGYLTIKETFTHRQRMMFRLRIPNLEVKIALGDVFIDGYTGHNPSSKLPFQDHLYNCLEQGDLEGMTGVIKRLFAGIPYRNFTGNSLPDVEGYYASVLYAFFASLDARVIPEDVTNHGQVDMTVRLGKNVYVMEIKVIKESDIDHNPALDQVQKMDYARKYRGEPGVMVHELGLVFSRAERNVIRADWRAFD